jgi:hypothetical protein
MVKCVKCNLTINCEDGYFNFPLNPMCTPCGSVISDIAKKEGNLMLQLRKIHELTH